MEHRRFWIFSDKEETCSWSSERVDQALSKSQLQHLTTLKSNLWRQLEKILHQEEILWFQKSLMRRIRNIVSQLQDERVNGFQTQN